MEAAIIVPLIILLTFGAIEFGFAFNEQGTVRSATRSAARAAATQSKKLPPADLEASAMGALSTSMKNLTNGQPQFALVYDHRGTDVTSRAACLGRPDCRVYDWNTATKQFVAAGGDVWTPTERAACAGRTENVAVFVQIRHDYLTGLPFTGSGSVDLTSTTVMALEPYPGASCEDNHAP